ncbi:MAG: MFS transporter [Methanomassiliicoccales archaeon]|nr:MFS transporter [Methanomassiliicoccales archaeon]MDD1755984.1 MFS transporter [Methanomassiliicoccales archaeon]
MGLAKSKGEGDRWYYTFLPYNVAGGSTSPMIPLFVTEGLKGSIAEVGIVGAISSLASVPANILWGNLSDTTKKRKVFVLIGFLGLAIALLTMGLSMDMGAYYFGNFLLGAIAAAAAPVSTVIILESFAKEQWAKRIGDFSKISGIGWVLGLVLGTIWLQLANGDGSTVAAMRGLFITSSALCVVSVLLAIKWVPEPVKKMERKEAVGEVPAGDLLHFERGRYAPTKIIHIMKVGAKNLSPRNFPSNLKLYYVMTFLAFTGFLTFYTAFPIFLKRELGLTISEVFLVYLASSITSALTYSLAGRWTSMYGGKRVQTVAFVGRIILFPSVFLVTLVDLEFWPLMAMLCALHAGIGFCWANLSVAGNTIVSRISYRDFRTESLGAYNAIMGIGTIVGSLVGGFVATLFGYEATFLVASVFVVSALALLLVLKVDEEPDEASSPHAAES